MVREEGKEKGCVRVLGEQRSQRIGWFCRVKGSRAVPGGKPDWSQLTKGLKCEVKLFGFLFGR